MKKLGSPHEGLVKIFNPNFNEKLPKIHAQSWKKVSPNHFEKFRFYQNQTPKQ